MTFLQLYLNIRSEFLDKTMGRFIKLDKTRLLPKDNSSFEIPDGYGLSLEFHYRGYNGIDNIYRDTDTSLALFNKINPESKCAIIGFESSGIKNGEFYIKQLQSRKKIGIDDLPRKWERILLESSINLAKELECNQVQVQKAENNWYYNSEFEDEDFLERLRIRYNVTAKRRGFTLDDKLDRWVLNI